MLTLRIARRANADVCWSVSVAIERCLLLNATSMRTSKYSTKSTAFIAPVSHSRRFSDAARARMESTSISDMSMTAPDFQQFAELPELNEEAMKELFRFEDYDCVGFDLDNTICRYKVCNMVKMEYDALAQYLINECHYSAKYLSQPIEEDGVQFMIKGLILDVKKGNLLRIAPDGKILHASHGSKELTQNQIISYYGPEMRWEVTDLFIRDPLHTWNGPLSESMRTLSDYFDMPVSLAFARAVDTLDEVNNGPLDNYDIYPHIQQALQNMFQKEHFGMSKGGYFPNVISNPDNYIHKCSDNLINWFKELKKTKLLFLITGSNVDFASHTATKSLGANWAELFDIVICFAKKPGFFTQKRPFKALDGFVETHEVSDDDLQRGGIYTSGNWDGVYKFLKKTSGKPHPKVVYIGDHLIQDVYTPSAHTNCDTVAVCEELEAEGIYGHEKTHHDDDFLVSRRWGSYFHHNEKENVWLDFLRKHAKLVVPSLEYVAKFPTYHRFSSLQ